MRNMKPGFSMLEVILAGALLLIFSVGATVAALSVLDQTRLGREEMMAVRYASSGMEAVRSIRNRSFEALSETSGSGTAVEDGVLTLSGEHDTFEKYVRTIIIREARRDADGNIVEGGGTPDPDTVHVTVSVSWDFTPSRHETLDISAYLTRWQDPL